MTGLKRKIFTATLAVFALLALFAFSVSIGNVSASSYKKIVYTDDFNADGIGDKWILQGAELKNDYYALSMINMNVWQPGINFQVYKIEKNSTVTFDAIFLKGQWLGVGFGLSKPTERFHNANCSIMLYASPFDKTELQTQGEEGTLSNSTTVNNEHYKGAFSNYNVLTTVKININDDGSMDLYAGPKDGEIKLLGNFKRGFAEGYMGFTAMGPSSVDILNFKYEHSDTVYEDDFTQSKMGYTSTGNSGKQWYVSYYYGENNVKIGASSTLSFKENQSALYKDELRNNRETDEQFEFSFKLRVEKLDEGAFAGISFGLRKDYNDISQGSFIGLGRKGDNYYLAFVENGKIKDVLTSFDKESFAEAFTGLTDMSVKGDYYNSLTVTVCGESYTVDTNYDGYFAIGSYAEGEATASFAIDDVSFVRFYKRFSDAVDVAINFKGVKEERYEDEDSSYYDYYVNKYEFYVGKNVQHIMYAEDKNGNAKPNDKLSFTSNKNDISSTSVFAPRNKYDDFIVRFDFTVTKDAEETPAAARIGVGFGMNSIYYYPTDGSYFSFQNSAMDDKGNSVGVTEGNSVIAGRGMNVVKNGEVGGTGEYLNSGYQIWSAGESGFQTFNVVILVENGRVRVFYKTQDEPEEMLSVLRAEFVNANTYGYVSVFGYDGASFNLENFSVENLNAYAVKGLDGFTSAANSIVPNEKSSDSIAYFELTADKTAKIELGFADCKLTLSDSGVSGDDKITFSDNGFDFSELTRGARIRVEAINGIFTLSVRSDGAESDLYEPVITGAYPVLENKTGISLSYEGAVSVRSAKNIALGYKDIENNPDATKNYDADQEAKYIKLVVKPERSQHDTDESGCGGKVKGVYSTLIITVAVFAVLSIIKKKERDNI